MGLLETHFIDISTEVVPMNCRAVTQGLSDKKKQPNQLGVDSSSADTLDSNFTGLVV